MFIFEIPLYKWTPTKEIQKYSKSNRFQNKYLISEYLFLISTKNFLACNLIRNPWMHWSINHLNFKSFSLSMEFQCYTNSPKQFCAVTMKHSNEMKCMKHSQWATHFFNMFLSIAWRTLYHLISMSSTKQNITISFETVVLWAFNKPYRSWKIYMWIEKAQMILVSHI